MGRGAAHTGFWWGNMRKRGKLVDPRRKWDDNIEINLQEMGSVYMDWINLAQDWDRWWALVNAIMNLQVT